MQQKECGRDVCCECEQYKMSAEGHLYNVSSRTGLCVVSTTKCVLPAVVQDRDCV